MPRYLFHLYRDGVGFSDSKGQQLDDADQAGRRRKPQHSGSERLGEWDSSLVRKPLRGDQRAERSGL
jgi:hypothetical protein